MNCYCETDCKRFGRSKCNKSCRAYILLEAIYSTSNIPLRYRRDEKLYPDGCDLNSFKSLRNFKDNIIDNVSEGKGLFIYSKNTGNGKTSWAIKMLNEYIKKMVFKRDLDGFDKMVYYVNTPELLEELRQGYSTGEYGSIICKLKEADVVVFDDIGAEKATEWVRERLYTIINYRINNLKSNIFTSNLDIEQIGISLGDRIASRIRDNNYVIELQGTDRRG